MYEIKVIFKQIRKQLWYKKYETNNNDVFEKVSTVVVDWSLQGWLRFQLPRQTNTASPREALTSRQDRHDKDSGNVYTLRLTVKYEERLFSLFEL